MVYLIHLKPGSPMYNYIHNSFVKGWKNPDKTAEITDIFYIVRNTPHEEAYRERFRQHQEEVKRHAANATSYLFHGTQRACMIGEDAAHVEICHNPECYLCSIIRCSWKLSKVAQRRMYGHGLYTTPVSSKADTYSKNSHLRSKKHAMILGDVVTGRKQIVYHHNSRLTPSPGYDSVEAATKAHGGEVNYVENIVYREDAILPGALVMYTRTGWKPHD